MTLPIAAVLLVQSNFADLAGVRTAVTSGGTERITTTVIASCFFSSER